MDVDLSPVVPEAREQVQRAIDVYRRHFDGKIRCILIHGSAFKGDFIEGSSDIDLQLHLDDSAFDDGGQISMEVGAAVQTGLMDIDPSPFSYLQCYPLSKAVLAREGWLVPISGTYRALVGELPYEEPSDEQILEAAKRSLRTRDRLRATSGTHLLGVGGGRLPRHVRLMTTDLWPTIRNYLTVLNPDDPAAPWRLTKFEAIDSLPAGRVNASARAALEKLMAFYPEATSATLGVVALQAISDCIRAIYGEA